MTENEISKIIINSAFKIHKTIGSGLLEKVYKECLEYELNKAGLFVEKEKPIPVVYESVQMDCGYRIDLLVERKVVIELKVVEEFNDSHIAQTLTYMRFANCKLGLLLNFYKSYFKEGIKRLVL